MTNPMLDIIPAKARKIIYAVLSLAFLVFTVYQASAGDWDQFVGGLITTLIGLLATANTAPVVPPPDDPPPFADDGNGNRVSRNLPGQPVTGDDIRVRGFEPGSPEEAAFLQGDDHQT